MFNDIDSEELAIIQKSIDNIMMFRFLLDRGYDISKEQVRVTNQSPGKVDISYGYDDINALEYENGDYLSELIFKGVVEYDGANSLEIGACLSTDVEENEHDLMKWTIKEPKIMNFYKYCEDNGIGKDHVIFQRYFDLASSLIHYGDQWSDCTYYESYASEDLSEGLVLIVSGCEFINYEFVRDLFGLYDYCEEVVKGEYPK